MSTEAPAPPVDAPAPPAPTPAAPAPAPATPTADWETTPAPRQRGRRDRGMPVAPVLTAVGNVAALTGTAAYEAGGIPGLAVAGVAVAGGGAAAVVRRRSSVRRSMASRSAGSRGGSGGGSGVRRTGPGSHTLGGGSRGGAGRSRGGATSNWGTGRSGGAGRLLSSGAGRSPGASRTGGLFGPRRGPAPSSGGTGTARHTLRAANRAARRNGRGNTLPARAARAVGRGIARPFRAGSLPRQATVRAARLAARAARLAARATRGAVWDGIKTVVAATFGRRRGRNALTRLRDAWTRYRKTRADKAAAKAAAAAAATVTPPAPLAATVRRPAGTPTPATFTGGAATMSGHHFTGPAMEMARAAAAYQPQGMLQVGQDFAGLQQALELVAEAMKITVDNADARQPLAPPIVDHMKEIWQLQMRAAELAGELPTAFQNLHRVDIDRLENPRKGPEGEAMWDVRANR